MSVFVVVSVVILLLSQGMLAREIEKLREEQRRRVEDVHEAVRGLRADLSRAGGRAEQRIKEERRRALQQWWLQAGGRPPFPEPGTRALVPGERRLP